MDFRTRYRRKAPSSPEVQGLFFDKAQIAPAFFNPSHQTSDHSTGTVNHSTAMPVVQRQEGAIAPPKPEEEQPVQKQVKQEDDKPVQKQAKEEEPPVQKQDNQNDKEPVQAKGGVHRPSGISEGQEQTTGLPDRLKTGVEALSGMAMDDVKVHYNSLKPAQMRALAYTQGTDIYLAPSQEKHLPHEVWHVVQQKQGRVEPTMQAKGLGINDDQGLEREATVMGQKANVEHPSLA